MEEIKCPKCGKTHYEMGVSTSTSMYCAPVVDEDGVHIKDPNIYTTECKCLECGQKFNICQCGNKVVITPVENPTDETIIHWMDEYEPIIPISCDDTVYLRKKCEKKYSTIESGDKFCWTYIDGFPQFGFIANYEPKLILNCKEIHLKQDSIEITMNIENLKKFKTIVVDGIEFERKVKK